jgi:hypothetical protein
MFYYACPIYEGGGGKLGTFQSLRNQLEINEIKSVPYASAIRSIMYAQVCTCPDLAFVTGLLRRFQSNLGIKHWKAAKKTLRYLQGTKHYMLIYKRTDNLEVIGYSDSDFVGCVDSQKVDIRLYLHTHKWSYIMKKLQAKNHYILNDVR